MVKQTIDSLVLIGSGGELHRAIALAVTEKDIPVLLAAMSKDQEFLIHSIANELWSLRKEHSVHIQDVHGVKDVEDLFLAASKQYGTHVFVVVISSGNDFSLFKATGFQQIDPSLPIGEAVKIVLEHI